MSDCQSWHCVGIVCGRRNELYEPCTRVECVTHFYYEENTYSSLFWHFSVCDDGRFDER